MPKRCMAQRTKLASRHRATRIIVAATRIIVAATRIMVAATRIIVAADSRDTGSRPRFPDHRLGLWSRAGLPRALARVSGVRGGGGLPAADGAPLRAGDDEGRAPEVHGLGGHTRLGVCDRNGRPARIDGRRVRIDGARA